MYHRIYLKVEYSGAVHQTLDCLSSLEQVSSLNAVAVQSVVWMSTCLLSVAANCVGISARINYNVAEIFQQKSGWSRHRQFGRIAVFCAILRASYCAKQQIIFRNYCVDVDMVVDSCKLA